MPIYAVRCPVCGDYERAATVESRKSPCDKVVENDICGEEIEIVYKPNGGKAFGDDIPGGIWIENLGPHPVKVYSHTERLDIARSQKLEECVRHTSVPGTDKSPHTTNWNIGPSGDPRPFCMLSEVEKAARRQEAAERLGISVQELDAISGDSVHSVDTGIDTEAADAAWADRTITNRFSVEGSGVEANEILRIVRESEGRGNI